MGLWVRRTRVFFILIATVEKEMSFLRNCGKETNLGAANAQRGHKKRGHLAQRPMLFGSFHVQLAAFKGEISHKIPVFLRICPHWSPCPTWHQPLVELRWLCLAAYLPGLWGQLSWVPALQAAHRFLEGCSWVCHDTLHVCSHQWSGGAWPWDGGSAPRTYTPQRTLVRRTGTAALTAPSASTSIQGHRAKWTLWNHSPGVNN